MKKLEGNELFTSPHSDKTCRHCKSRHTYQHAEGSIHAMFADTEILLR